MGAREVEVVRELLHDHGGVLVAGQRRDVRQAVVQLARAEAAQRAEPQAELRLVGGRDLAQFADGGGAVDEAVVRRRVEEGHPHVRPVAQRRRHRGRQLGFQFRRGVHEPILPMLEMRDSFPFAAGHAVGLQSTSIAEKTHTRLEPGAKAH